MHYEKIILVDPRYYRGEMQEIMPSEGDVQVLFLFGAESFFTQNHLGRLLF